MNSRIWPLTNHWHAFIVLLYLTALELTLEVTYADYALPVRVSEQLATILQAVSEDGADFMITEEFGLSLPPITVAVSILRLTFVNTAVY